MSRHSLSVAGLRCAHCVQILERNLRRIPGVRRVEIRPVDEQVEVEADPRLVSEAVLAAAVRDSGLHVQRARRPGFAERPGPQQGVDQARRARERRGEHRRVERLRKRFDRQAGKPGDLVVGLGIRREFLRIADQQ